MFGPSSPGIDMHLQWQLVFIMQGVPSSRGVFLIIFQRVRIVGQEVMALQLEDSPSWCSFKLNMGLSTFHCTSKEAILETRRFFWISLQHGNLHQFGGVNIKHRPGLLRRKDLPHLAKNFSKFSNLHRQVEVFINTTCFLRFPLKRTLKWPMFRHVSIIFLNMKTAYSYIPYPLGWDPEVDPIVSVKLSLKIKSRSDMIWSLAIGSMGLAYLPTFGNKNMVNVGKYIPYMDPMGYVTWVTCLLQETFK